MVVFKEFSIKSTFLLDLIYRFEKCWVLMIALPRLLDRVLFGLGFRSFPPLYTSLFDGNVPRARPDSAFAELLPSGQALQRQVADSFSHAAQLRWTKCHSGEFPLYSAPFMCKSTDG